MKKSLIAIVLFTATLSLSTFTWAENAQQENSKASQPRSTTEFFKTTSKYKDNDVTLYSIALDDNKSVALIFNPNEEAYDDDDGGDSPSITYIKFFDADGKDYQIISAQICDDYDYSQVNNNEDDFIDGCKTVGFFPSTLPEFGQLVESIQNSNPKVKRTWSFAYLKDNNVEYTMPSPVPKLGALVGFRGDDGFSNEGMPLIYWDYK